MDAPSSSFRVLSSVIHISCVSVLAYVFAGRCRLTLLLAMLRGKPATWTRICSIMVFTLSWLFAFSASVLVLGVGISSTQTACSSAIILCVVVYAITKVFIYCFLVDKVYVVWTAGTDPGRLHSRLWKLCMLGVLCYFAIFIALFIWRQSAIDETGQCEIGLKRNATIPLLTYDLFLTGFLTSLFVYPLMRKTMNPRLRKTAIKALIAALASLASSSVNVAVLVAIPNEPGWVCMACCVADVTVNALALYYVTSGPEAPSPMLSIVSQKKRLRPGRPASDGETVGARTIGLSTVGEMLPDMSLEDKDARSSTEEDVDEDKEKQELCVCGRPKISFPLSPVVSALAIPTPPAAHLSSPPSLVQIARQESFTITHPSATTPTTPPQKFASPSPSTRRKHGWSSWGGSGDVSITLAIPVADPRVAQPPGLNHTSPLSASDSHSHHANTPSASSMIPSSLHIPPSAIASTTSHHPSLSPATPSPFRLPHPVLRRFSSSPPRMRIGESRRVSKEQARKHSVEKHNSASSPYECECGCGLVGESSTTAQLPAPPPAVKPKRSFTSLGHPPSSYSPSASPIASGRKSSDPAPRSRTSSNTPKRRERRPSTAPQSPSADLVTSPLSLFSGERSDQPPVRPRSSAGRLGSARESQLASSTSINMVHASSSISTNGGGSIGPERTTPRRPSLRRLSSKPSFMRLRGMMEMLRTTAARDGKHRAHALERGRTLETALVFDDEGSSSALNLSGGASSSGNRGGSSSKAALPRRATTVPMGADEDRHSLTSSSAGHNHLITTLPAPSLPILPVPSSTSLSAHPDQWEGETLARDHDDGASISVSVASNSYPTRTRTRTADSSTPLIMDEPRELEGDHGHYRISDAGRRGSGGGDRMAVGRQSQSDTLRNASSEGRRSVTH